MNKNGLQFWCAFLVVEFFHLFSGLCWWKTSFFSSVSSAHTKTQQPTHTLSCALCCSLQKTYNRNRNIIETKTHWQHCYNHLNGYADSNCQSPSSLCMCASAYLGTKSDKYFQLLFSDSHLGQMLHCGPPVGLLLFLADVVLSRRTVSAAGHQASTNIFHLPTWNA